MKVIVEPIKKFGLIQTPNEKRQKTKHHELPIDAIEEMRKMLLSPLLTHDGVPLKQVNTKLSKN